MSWQDELTRLDEELAAGQLSAEDYRRRRDELLAKDAADPGGGEPQPAPFPPAFRWETGPPAETTQVMQPIGDEPDRTQVVHPQSPEDSERTQVVHGGPPPQQGQWNQGGDDSAPPWASSDIAPIQQPNSAWMAQGQTYGADPFEPTSKRKSGKGRVIGVVLAVVLVLAAGAVGVFALLSGGDDPQAAPATTAEQQPAEPEQAATPPEPETTTAPAPPPGADLPDPAPIGGDGLPRVLATFADLQGAGVLSPEELGIYERAGATESKLLPTTFSDGPTVNLLITRVGSPEQAAAARDELAALQEAAGFTPATGPEGLRSSFQVEDPAIDPTVRGYYRSGDLLIRMDVVGPEARPTAERYDAAINQQLGTLPAEP